jgi:NTP pyrophosphatase (non-canonical NTP hydrolase)
MNIKEHLLACLAEECCEVGQMANKSLRFGLDDSHPEKPEIGTNLERLIDELNDLDTVILVLEEENIIPKNWRDYKKRSAKLKKIAHYTEHAIKSGALCKES